MANGARAQRPPSQLHRSRQELDRRQFLRGLLATGAAASLPRCRRRAGGDRRVVVLGLDGLDPQLIGALMNSARAPNFVARAARGGFVRLGTTMPALSPVAWSSFITGLTPGGHGIGDFIHRDPANYLPVFSIYETLPATRTLSLGGYQLPIAGGGMHRLRRGRPFWSHLAERGIPSEVYRIPTSFPVEEEATRALSGMGTPDLADAYGLFNYYTSDPFEDYPDVSGGYVHYVELRDDHARADLIGPLNSFRSPQSTRRDETRNHSRSRLDVYVDRSAGAARIDLASRSIVLRVGEWSEWLPVEFELVPLVGTANGICRLLLRAVEPHLQLYVSPINIDPGAQAVAVTYPEELGGELARAIGPFHTMGLPCDTKALDHRIFRDEDYVSQAEQILGEQLRLFDYTWSRFAAQPGAGFYFFYISNTDQDAHMLWRNMDATHPMHRASDVRFAGYLHHLYERMDVLVGRVLEAADDDTLVLVCSDHGFAQFGRQFHLNTWLRERGLLRIKDEARHKKTTDLGDIDWRRTVAYGLGFNGLYLNLKGREKQGLVEPGSGRAREVLGLLRRELTAVNDPETGRTPIAQVYERDRLYRGALTPDMPELLVGYRPGYRSSSDSVLGATGEALIEINPWAWSGDQSMACELIPGSLFSSRPVAKSDSNIVDLPVTILEWFGIPRPEEMVGRSVFAGKRVTGCSRGSAAARWCRRRRCS